MPYADSDGVRIHYRVEGNGPPLVLTHWSLGSLAGWHEYGYVDLLAADYTVIAHDVRGHGKSDKPHDPADYALESRVADIVAILDDLGLERAHFYGYSMGGWIGFGAAKHAPERFRSFAIGGAHPYAQDMSGLRDLLTVGVDLGGRAFVDRFQEIDEDFTMRHETQWLKADFVAQRAAARDRSSLEETLSRIDCPCLVAAGTEDGVFFEAKRSCAAIPNGRFEALSGLDHGTALARSDLVVPLLRMFLANADG
jgi:pimeloyl-ACP methyl ester carboxylesterase